MTASPAIESSTGLRPARADSTGLRPSRRPIRRVATAFALAAGASLALTACGAGQVSQTADQVASINGNNVDASSISLRNVHVAYPDSEEYSLEAGGKAQLVFTAVNTSEYLVDTLEGIETEGAEEVTFIGGTGNIEIPPQTAVAAGAPADQEPQDSEEPSTMILVELEGLSEFVRPGLTVPMTFQFAEAGDVTIEVPVDAGPTTPRLTDDKSGPHEEESAAAEGE